jgi:hypothetical protein
MSNRDKINSVTNEETRNKRIIRLSEQLPEMKERAFRNYFFKLVKYWSILIIGSLAAPLFLLIIHLIGLYLGNPDLQFTYTTTDLKAIATSLFAPTITIIGLCITFLPVIIFFYLGNIREKQEKTEKRYRKLISSLSNPEDRKIAKLAYDYSHAYWHNFRVGILKYLRFYIVNILILLQTVVLFYVIQEQRYGYFLMLAIGVLYAAISGVVPIVQLALNQPGLKLRKYVKKVVEKIEYD